MNQAASLFVHRRSIIVALPAIAALGVIAIFAAPTRSQQPAQGDQPAPGPSAQAAGDPAAANAPITPERVAKLEKMLSGCTLVGQFTVNGAGEMKPREERYELSSVKHIQGDMWLVTARIKYGDHDVTVPLPLPIRWAGDTPVITLDKFAVPGMGAYSARVMFYENRYMGYWSAANNDHGGYMFGVIEPPKADAPAETKDAKAEPAAK